MATDINTQLQNISTDVTAIGNLVNRLTTIFSAGGVQNPDLAVMKSELQAWTTTQLASYVTLTTAQIISGAKTFTGASKFSNISLYIANLPYGAPSSDTTVAFSASSDAAICGYIGFGVYSNQTSNTEIRLYCWKSAASDTTYYRSIRMSITKAKVSTCTINTDDVVFGHVLPRTTNTFSLGSNSVLWSHVFANDGTIQSSDERYKTEIAAIPDVVLDAWGSCNFVQFKFIDSVKSKGAAARIHFGCIAQQLKTALEKAGIDPTKYGFFCYDAWEDKYSIDESGKEVLVVPAGDRYALRYDQLLVLEVAYQRRELNRIKARLGA